MGVIMKEFFKGIKYNIKIRKLKNRFLHLIKLVNKTTDEESIYDEKIKVLQKEIAKYIYEMDKEYPGFTEYFKGVCMELVKDV